MKTPAAPFYFFVAGVFLLLVSPHLLSEGMFMDGLIYASIAKNLSQGIGTFWLPHFTKTFIPEFYGHPPLAIGIHSLFYTIFGYSTYVDKLYSFFTYLIVAFIIVRIWKVLEFKHGWLPLFFWILVPLVWWGSTNNMLENTLMVFTSSAALFYLNYQKNNNYVFLLLFGIMMVLGFFAKGFVAFFPLALPFFNWLIWRKKTFWKMVVDTLSGVFLMVASATLIVIINSEASAMLEKYLNAQVVESIKNVATVESRFFIVGRLFMELLPGIIVCIILFIYAYKKQLLKLPASYKQAWVFLLLGLSGVIPIMVTLKQRAFYMLPAFPFFAIAFAVLAYPIVQNWFVGLNVESKAYLIFKRLSYGIFALALVLVFYFSGTIGRDKNKIQDSYIIMNQLKEGEVINIHPSMSQDWSLYGYYARYKYISLDVEKTNREYLLLEKSIIPDSSITNNYKLLPLNTVDYTLYKKL